MTFGPKTAEEAIIFAEENLRVDLQHFIQQLLTSKGQNRRALAAKADMTEQQLSQLFGSRSNPTLRTIARIFHALGEECVITSRASLEAELKRHRGLTGSFGPGTYVGIQGFAQLGSDDDDDDDDELLPNFPRRSTFLR